MKDSNARLTRWYLSLQPYKFTISYKKGQAHINADFLSRQGMAGASAGETPAAPYLSGEACQDEAQEGMAASCTVVEGDQTEEIAGGGKTSRPRGVALMRQGGPSRCFRSLPRQTPRSRPSPRQSTVPEEWAGTMPVDKWPGSFEMRPLSYFKELWEAEMRGRAMDTSGRRVTFGPGVRFGRGRMGGWRGPLPWKSGGRIPGRDEDI